MVQIMVLETFHLSFLASFPIFLFYIVLRRRDDLSVEQWYRNQVILDHCKPIRFCINPHFFKSLNKNSKPT